MTDGSPTATRTSSRRRSRITALVAILLAGTVAALVACGPGGAARSTSTPWATHPVSTPGIATGDPQPLLADPARYLAAARAEAARLARSVPLPTGSLVHGAYPSLPGPAMGIEDGSHFLDVTRYYAVPMPLAQARAWFRANPPRGVTPFGGNDGTGSGQDTMYGLAWTGPDDPRWRNPWAQVALIASGSGTAVRVDGTLTWYDPTPVRIRSMGPTVRVTVKGGCPANDKGVDGVKNETSEELLRALVPASPPTAELKCTYGGMNGRPYTLRASTRVEGAAAIADARAFRRMPVGSTGTGVINCPADFDQVKIIAFSYADGPDIDLWQHATGCRWTSNGFIRSSWF